MKIAALILCHSNLERVNRLISVLNDDEVDIFIHADKKSTFSVESLTKNDHVFCLPDNLRVEVEWGQYSQVEAIHNLMKYSTAQNNYDYYIMLSGVDYPIKPLSELKTFLSNNLTNNYINLFPSKEFNNNNKPSNHDKCCDLYYPNCLLKRYGLSRIFRRIYVMITGGYGHTFKLFLHRNPTGLKNYFGGTWWCFSHDVVKYMLDYIDHNPEYVKFFRKCICPDESFFHTLFMNSKYAYTRNDYLHYVDWSEHKNSPKDLTGEDFEKLSKCGYFFARKIIDDDLLNMIDTSLLK